MKNLLAVMLVLSGLGFTQTGKTEQLTARQYYEELKAASGVNPLQTWVCFRPDTPDAFDLLGFTKEFEATAKSKGIPLKPKDRKMFEAADSLFIQTYVKGVKTGEDELTHDKDHQESWSDDVQSKGHRFHLIVTLSPAGRYRRAVYVDDIGGVAKADSYGKCEPIQ